MLSLFIIEHCHLVDGQATCRQGHRWAYIRLPGRARERLSYPHWSLSFWICSHTQGERWGPLLTQTPLHLRAGVRGTQRRENSVVSLRLVLATRSELNISLSTGSKASPAPVTLMHHSFLFSIESVSFSNSIFWLISISHPGLPLPLRLEWKKVPWGQSHVGHVPDTTGPRT